MSGLVRSNLPAVALVAGCLAVGFAAGPRLLNASRSPAPNLTITPPVAAMGHVAEYAALTRIVWLRNTGRAPLVLEHVTTSCGCTTTDAPTTIAPGQQAPLTVHFNSRDKRGPIHERVHLFLADHPDQPLDIPLSGDVARDLTVTPTQFSLGTVRGGERRQIAMTLTRSDGQPLDVRPDPASPLFSTQTRRVSDRETRVVATFTIPPTSGPRQDTLALRVDCANLPILNVPVEYTVAGAYRLSQETLNFGAIPADMQAHASLHIGGADTTRLHVLHAPDGMMISLARVPNGECVLDAKYTPKGGRGTLVESRIVLRTGNPFQPEIVIPVYAAVS